MNRILPSDIRYGVAPAPDQTDVAEAAKVGKPQPNATQPDTGPPSATRPTAAAPSKTQPGATRPGTESAGTISHSDNAVAIVSDLIARGTMPRIDTTPLLTHKDLPGPLSMARLTHFGTLHSLDQTNAYSAEHADTQYGRAMIALKLIPFGTIACALTAAWVWLGGTFPRTVDVISSSHYRADSHGRKIRVFNRKTAPEHVIQVGNLRITTPMRTACDIALLTPGELNEHDACDVLCALFEEYQVSLAQCMQTLDDNHFWPNTQPARELFTSMKHFF